VSFLPKTAELAGRSGSRVPSLGQVELINTEAYPIALTPMKTIVPPWISYNMSFNETKTADIPGTYTMIGPGESMTIGIVVNPSSLEEGTALSSVTFGVFLGRNQTGCAGADIGFDVYMRVERPPTLNHLGNIGLVLFCINALTAIGFGGWVFKNRNARVVSVMQPVFLIAISIGIFLIATSMLGLSIDDGRVSPRGCDIACVSTTECFSLLTFMFF
jgi:hypothetical protein